MRELQQRITSLRWYYMGFYIHSCPKMRYKGKYKPSYLLCPETYEWIPIDLATPKLDRAKYSRLTDNPNAVDVNGQVDINKVRYISFILSHEIIPCLQVVRKVFSTTLLLTCLLFFKQEHFLRHSSECDVSSNI